jgi:hypothetical protein
VLILRTTYAASLCGGSGGSLPYVGAVMVTCLCGGVEGFFLM